LNLDKPHHVMERNISVYTKGSLIGLALACSVSAHAATSAKWGYSGDAAPEHWGALKAEYATCATGKAQSPIDLNSFVDKDLPPIKFNYGTNATVVLNNGHTVQANYAAGSTIDVAGEVFELKQFHFHTPSENHIKGKSFPLEVHLVHANKEGKLAVVGVVFDLGDENPLLAKVWQQLPEKAGDEHKLEATIKVQNLLPENRDYYRFSGSLTTPPCTEGVTWLVMKNPVTVSQSQVDAFAKVLHHTNNRPIQPLNGREILE